MRWLCVQRFLEAGALGFLLGFALGFLLARFHRAGFLDRSGFLGQPHLAEVTLADVREDVRYLRLVEGLPFQEFKCQLVQDVPL